jgi:hypothetical protein
MALELAPVVGLDAVGGVCFCFKQHSMLSSSWDRMLPKIPKRGAYKQKHHMLLGLIIF